VTRFAQAMEDMGAEVDLGRVRARLDEHYRAALAAQ
jgi:hypothetical protein